MTMLLLSSRTASEMWQTREENVDESDAYLLAPYRYLIRVPGKKVRTQLIQAYNGWLNVESGRLKTICELIECLHNASLMVDDIEDGSTLRRGLPVTHAIYGLPRTLNSANYMYFEALRMCLSLQSNEATRLFSEAMLDLHRGQGKELFWRDALVCPTEGQYEKMVEQKTGGVFFLAVRLMRCFSDDSRPLEELNRLFSLFFQIRDDYQNLTSDEMAEQKSWAEDLTEGKFSYPVLHALTTRKLGRDDELLSILRKHTADLEMKRYAVRLLEEAGSLRATYERLQELATRIGEELEKLGGNEALRGLLDKLVASMKKPSSAAAT